MGMIADSVDFLASNWQRSPRAQHGEMKAGERSAVWVRSGDLREDYGFQSG